MQVTNLVIRNFLSYKDVEIPLKQRGLILIEGENRDQGGSNGAGKTTILHALCWGIFGMMIDGRRGNDIVRHKSKNTEVTITLEVDGVTGVVSRYRKHKEKQNQILFTINGVDSRGATDRETQENILAFIQLDWNTFISVVMFPQGEKGIAAWSDAEQKTVLQTILGLDRFQRAREAAHTLLNDTRARESRLVEDLRSLTMLKEKTQEHLAELNAQEKTFETQREAAITQAREALNAAVSTEPPEPNAEPLHELHRKIAESRQDDVIQMISQVEHEMRQVQDELTMDEARRVNLLDQAKRWAGEVVDPEEELKRHADCPSCGQLLPEEAREKLYSTFSEQAFKARQHAEDARRQAAEISAGATGRDERLAKLRELLGDLRGRLVDVTELEIQARELEVDLQKGRAAKAAWEREVEAANWRLRQQEAQSSPYTKLIESASKSLKDAESQADVVDKELGPIRDDLKYLLFWKVGFGNGGVKSLLMSTITPYLNERANYYFRQMTGNAATINIKTQKTLKSGELRDKLDFEVHYPNAGGLYAAKSGGERRRADIAILFALGDLAAGRARAPVRLRLLDEVFENLDAVGCEQVASLLQKNFVREHETVLVITHNEALSTLFEKRMKVVKVNGISEVEGS